MASAVLERHIVEVGGDDPGLVARLAEPLRGRSPRGARSMPYASKRWVGSGK